MSVFSSFFDKLRANPKVREFIFKFNPSHKTLTRLRRLAVPEKKKSPLMREIEVLEKHLEAIEFKLNLLMDYYIDVGSARDAVGYLRQRQKASLLILKEFIKACNAAGIDYWLDFGSLLGAKRHGKFIPWDDDVDVAIIYQDMPKLEAIAESVFPEGFEFIPSNEIARLKYNGVTVDIFPYSDNGDRIKARYHSVNFPHCNRSIPKEIVFPVVTMQFDGVEAKVPRETDTYLRFQFGNYETLPKKPHPFSHRNKSAEYIVFYPDEKF
jgi:LPS biosynthesis protein